MNLTDIANCLKIINNTLDSNQILEEIKKLDHILNTHRLDLEPRLVHFLERRSYQKALRFIEEETDPQKGK